MTADQPFTAISPSDDSLTAHLQALDLLSARISSLTARTRWAARIPLNSKASILGQVVHTNELRIDIGGGYWVEMTAKEAEEYVGRRKTALLLQHAGLRENAPKSTSNDSSTSFLGLPTEVSFNPLFALPTAAGPSQQSQAEAERKGPVLEAAPPQTSSSVASPSHSEPLKDNSTPIGSRNSTVKISPTTLQDVVEQFLETQQGLANSSKDQIDKLKGLHSADALVTEEGLPIHEIREDLNGELIGEAPAPSWTGDTVIRVEEEDTDDYWSEEAKARREAKRRLIFGDDEGDEDDEEEEDGISDVMPGAQAQVQEPEEVEETFEPASSLPRRSSLTSSNHPRSILKPPGRKKSVTFDESIPLPPDSPPANNSGKMGFPLPTTDIGTEQAEFEPRPVPIIPMPKPAVKNTVGESFAGFKRGFLSASSSAKAKPDIASTSPDTPPAKKAPSLFAQRMAAQEHPRIEEISSEVAEEESVKPAVKEGIVERANGLPKMSENKHMSSMKPAVVERAPEPLPPSTRALTSSQIGMPSSSRPVNAGAQITELGEDEDEDENDEGEYEEDDDDDEYDLEQVIHAREIALEYHRLHASQHRPRREDDDDAMDVSAVMDSLYEEGLDDDEGAEDGEAGIGEGGVVMALPQLSAEGQIVNPTPDGIRQFVRVGRLDNGNLVLAPGEEGWSDDENEEKAKHREGLKRQLLGLDPPKPPALPQPKKPAVVDVGLPPAVVTEPIADVKEKQADKVVEQPVDKPKKVSRFKAARMGM